MLTTSLFGHIFNITSLSNQKHTIIACADYHISTQPENVAAIKKQQEDIIALANELGAVVVVEDVYSGNIQEIINDTTATIAPLPMRLNNSYDTIAIESPILYLQSRCADNEVECINVETRFSDFRTAANYMKYLSNKKAHILKYNDSLPFKMLYQNKLSHIQKHIEEPCKELFEYLEQQKISAFDALKQQNVPMIPYLDTILTALSPDQWDFKRMRYAGQLTSFFLMYESLFLDLDIIHAIAQQYNKRTIILCAGSSHIDHCIQLLQELGYQVNQTHGKNLRKTSDGRNFEEPQAVDISQCINIFDSHQEPPHSHTSFIMSAIAHYLSSIANLWRY